MEKLGAADDLIGASIDCVGVCGFIEGDTSIPLVPIFEGKTLPCFWHLDSNSMNALDSLP